MYSQDINENNKQASMAKIIIYMAWHRYGKVIASPSLTVGLNLPLTFVEKTFERSKRLSRFPLSHNTTTLINTMHLVQLLLMPLAT